MWEQERAQQGSPFQGVAHADLPHQLSFHPITTPPCPHLKLFPHSLKGWGSATTECGLNALPMSG